MKRTADERGLSTFLGLLEQGTPRWAVLEALFDSAEYRRLRNECTPLDVLHALRCQLVRQLPAAEVIVDLGGAAGSSIEGALLLMGYPHAPREITIIDLPPDSRMFADGFACIHQETTEWLVFGPTRVRYLHQSMSDLSGIADASVDLVWSGESIEHITQAEAGEMFQEVWRVLKPGGYFCLDTPNRAITQIQSPSQLIHPEHKLEYTASQLTRCLSEARFQIVQAGGLGPMPKTAQSGVFNWPELTESADLSDHAEICYLLYVKCRKPDLPALPASRRDSALPCPSME
ncbi:MAG: class I SAM-dependent methyltransferase [Verrucomicrobia bacterium]|nr:class I SAM-dependent methyltransferase [Verrucomicrobiota bacterium]